MKSFHKILRGFDRLADGAFYAGAFLMLVLPFIMSYEVVMRYFFTRPTTWAVDFSEYILLYGTFLTAGWLLKEGEHINLTFVLDRVSQRTRLVMRLIQSLIGIFACSFLLWSGIGATCDAIVRWVLIVRPISIPKWVVFWIIAFGALMLLVYSIRNLINSLAEFKAKPTAMAQQGVNAAEKKDDLVDKLPVG
jgi:C4-dicarboxylate transporter DctQ subunit